jgi:hypothetical protein
MNDVVSQGLLPARDRPASAQRARGGRPGRAGGQLTDQLIGCTATISVIIVSAIAAVISYGHAYQFVTRYGAGGLTARALPLTIDGLVATCSLVLVDCARHGRAAPWHAWFLLITGALAQIAANVAAGLSHGLAGAVVAGWPALVAWGSFDLLLRHRRSAPAPAAHPAGAPAAGHAAAGAGAADVATTARAAGPVQRAAGRRIPGGGDDVAPTVPAAAGAGDPALGEARELYGPGLAAGHVPSVRAIKRDLHVGNRRAAAIRDALAPAGPVTGPRPAGLAGESSAA